MNPAVRGVVRWCSLLALSFAASAAAAGEAGTVARDLPAFARGLDPRIECFSLVVEQDADGAGLDWEPDDSCEDETALELARVRHRSQVRDRREWLEARRRSVDGLLEAAPIHVRTPHFELVYQLDDIVVGKKRVKPAEGAALYAARLEDHVEWIAATLRIDPVEVKRANRHEVFLLRERESARRVTTELLGHRLGDGVKTSLVGPERSYVVLLNDSKRIESDEHLHQILVHTVAHNVYHDVGRYANWLNAQHGWLHAGLAHHDEIRRFGPPVTTCHRDDQLDFQHWLSPYWEANVRKAIQQRRDYDPAEVFALDVDQMNAKHRQFAWSYVDFLLWYEPERMAELLDRTKGEEKPTAEALQAVYGLDLATFHAEWKAFVTEHYSSRPRRGPTSERAPRRR